MLKTLISKAEQVIDFIRQSTFNERLFLVRCFIF